MTGKEKCNLLREIRREIAKANNIIYLSAECNYVGPCKGTCPVCDAEIKYLENELNEKVMRGEKITLSGISMDTFLNSLNDTQDEDIINFNDEYLEMGAYDELEDIRDEKQSHYIRYVDDLNLSEEITYNLKNADIYTLEELLEYSECELACEANLDEESISRIKETLFMMSLVLRPDEDDVIMGNICLYDED